MPIAIAITINPIKEPTLPNPPIDIGVPGDLLGLTGLSSLTFSLFLMLFPKI